MKSTRGSLTVAVEMMRVIAERHRIVLEPSDTPAPRRAARCGGRNYGGPPVKAAKSKFIWYAIGVTRSSPSGPFTKPRRRPPVSSLHPRFYSD